MKKLYFPFIYEKQKKEEAQPLYIELDIPRQEIPKKKEEVEENSTVIIIQL